MSDTPADAVYYQREDYAPITRRFGVLLIDFAVCFFLFHGTLLVYSLATVPAELKEATVRNEQTQQAMNAHIMSCGRGTALIWFPLCVVYSIAMRKTPIGTLGYLIMRVKLVDKTGRRPSWKTLGKRFLWGTPFALFFGLTYLAVRNTERRQAVHDQMCGTWVVKAGAQPAGLARTAFQTKFFGTYMLTYVDVEPIEIERAGSENALPEARLAETGT